MATFRALHAPKEGNTPEQYEDAFACGPDETLAGDRFTVAVADGASSAVFAREWARKLVKAFGASGFPAIDTEAAKIIAALGREWQAEVEAKATTWHAQEKMLHGSSATLLVVTWDRPRMHWEAVSVGDVCVFLIRRNKLRFAFPLTKSAKFNDRPALLTTRMGDKIPLPTVTRYSEKFEEGDRFLLMTDALAEYFLKDYETSLAKSSKSRPWHDLPETQETFAAYLKTHRDSGALKNDDVTLVDLVV